MWELRKKLPRRLFLALAAVLLVVLLLTFVLYLYMFRAVSESNSALGTIEHVYSWGVPHEVTIDVNKDGMVDGIYFLCDDAPDFSGPFEVAWQSSYCDSFFDVHLTFDCKGSLASLGYDGDRDGKYENYFLYREAREILAAQDEPCNGFVLE